MRRRNVAIGLVLCLFAGSLVAGVGAASFASPTVAWSATQPGPTAGFSPVVTGSTDPDGISVTHSAPTGSTLVPGGSVTIEATVNATGLNAPALAVSLPDGWAITSQSAEGPATFKATTNEWVWLAGDVEEPFGVTYTLQVPANAAAAEYTVDAGASAIDPDLGDQVVSSAAVDVIVSEAPAPVCGGCAPPGDPDRDGEYEDVNGYGAVSFSDVVALYHDLSSGPSGPTEPFDFNDDGSFTFSGVVALYHTL